MAFPQNEQDVQGFLEYCDVTKQNCRETVALRKNQLRYLQNWAEANLLSESPKMKISFPTYLSNLRTEASSSRLLCNTSIHATLNACRMFFTWAKEEHTERYGNIPSTWIDSLRLPRHLKNSELVREHEYYSFEDMIKIAAFKPSSLMERRGQAAMVFMYLTGMRVGAFLTLPIECVNMSQLKVFQVPAMGVSTKFQKAALTTFLNIPELLKVAREWDEDVRKLYPAYQTWFAPIRTKRGKYGEFYYPDTKASPYRSKELRREMIRICEKAGVTFLSAHKLRHGHAVYGIKHAQNIKELKAISQNMMHSSITITDSIYGNLTGDDFTETISGIGVKNNSAANEKDISSDLIRAILKLQDNPKLLQKILRA
jgi:site-specific recombinase XerD